MTNMEDDQHGNEGQYKQSPLRNLRDDLITHLRALMNEAEDQPIEIRTSTLLRVAKAVELLERSGTSRYTSFMKAKNSQERR